MIKKSLINTKDFIKMIKRATITNNIELLVREKQNKQWSTEYECENLDYENLFTFLDLLEYYFDNNYLIKVKIKNLVCYTNDVKDLIDGKGEYNE